MPGVQNKYAIDVTNRFAVDEDEIDEEENIDPFEELRQLNKQAEAIKNAPKPKVNHLFCQNMSKLEKIISIIF